MSASYRQKLLDWLCSIGMLLTAASLGPLFYWLIDLPPQILSGHSSNIVDVAGPLGGTLLIYQVFFPIILFWHFWDFIERERPLSGIKELVRSYRIFTWLLVAVIVVFLPMDSGLFTYHSCHDLDGAIYSACFVSPPWWLMYPLYALICLAIALCFTKAAISARSLVKPVP